MVGTIQCQENAKRKVLHLLAMRVLPAYQINRVKGHSAGEFTKKFLIIDAIKRSVGKFRRWLSRRRVARWWWHHGTTKCGTQLRGPRLCSSGTWHHDHLVRLSEKRRIIITLTGYTTCMCISLSWHNVSDEREIGHWPSSSWRTMHLQCAPWVYIKCLKGIYRVSSVFHGAPWRTV